MKMKTPEPKKLLHSHAPVTSMVWEEKENPAKINRIILAYRFIDRLSFKYIAGF